MKINSFLKVLVVQLTLVSTFFGSVSANYQEEAYSHTSQSDVESREVRELRIVECPYSEIHRGHGSMIRGDVISCLDLAMGSMSRCRDDNVVRVKNYLEWVKISSEATTKLFQRMVLAHRMLLARDNRADYRRQHQILSTIVSASNPTLRERLNIFIKDTLAVFVGDDLEMFNCRMQAEKANCEFFETRLCEMFKFLHPKLNFEIPSADVPIEVLSDDIFASILVATWQFYNVMFDVPLGQSRNCIFHEVQSRLVRVTTLVYDRFQELF
jgi:hypothetical protein